MLSSNRSLFRRESPRGHICTKCSYRGVLFPLSTRYGHKPSRHNVRKKQTPGASHSEQLQPYLLSEQQHLNIRGTCLQVLVYLDPFYLTREQGVLTDGRAQLVFLVRNTCLEGVSCCKWCFSMIFHLVHYLCIHHRGIVHRRLQSFWKFTFAVLTHLVIFPSYGSFFIFIFVMFELLLTLEVTFFFPWCVTVLMQTRRKHLPSE